MLALVSIIKFKNDKAKFGKAALSCRGCKLNYRNFSEVVEDCMAKNEIYGNFYAVTLSFSHVFKNSADNMRHIANAIKVSISGSSVYLFEVSGIHSEIKSHNGDKETKSHVHGVIFSKNKLDKKTLEASLGDILRPQKNGVRKVCVSNRSDDLGFWLGYIRDHSNMHDIAVVKDKYHCFKQIVHVCTVPVHDMVYTEESIVLESTPCMVTAHSPNISQYLFYNIHAPKYTDITICDKDFVGKEAPEATAIKTQKTPLFHKRRSTVKEFFKTAFVLTCQKLRALKLPWI